MERHESCDSTTNDIIPSLYCGTHCLLFFPHSRSTAAPHTTPHHTTIPFFLFRSAVVGMNARATSIGCLAGGRSWKGRAKGKVGRPVKCHSFMRAHENKQRLPPAWSAGHLRWRGGVGRLPATSTLSSLCLCRPPPQERTTLTQEAPKNGEFRFASRGENDKE